MKVGDLVRFKSNRADYEEFHGSVGLVVSVESLGRGDYKEFHGSVGLVVSAGESTTTRGIFYPVVRWLEPVLFHGKLSTESHFHANRYEVIQ